MPIKKQSQKEIITIYTDGACAGNQFDQNRGGWGGIVIFPDGKKEELSGNEINTTNNRMELTACIKALEHVGNTCSPITLYSDSAYIVNCFHQKWYLKWQKNNWLNSQKKPVENQDLWQRLLALTDRLEVHFAKVPAHAAVELNEMADRLAKEALAKISKK